MFEEVYAYSTGITFIFVLHCFLMCTASQMRSMASRPRCVILAFFLLLTLASAIRCGSGPEEKLVCRMWKNEYRRKCSDSSTGLRCRVLHDRLQTNGCVPSELILKKKITKTVTSVSQYQKQREYNSGEGRNKLIKKKSTTVDSTSVYKRTLHA